MKNIFLIILFCATGIVIAQESLQGNTPSVEYYKVIKVRIYVNDIKEISELRKRGMAIEHVKYQDGYFDVLIDEYDMKILKESGNDYEILIPDMTKDYLERTKDSREKIKKELYKGEKQTAAGRFGNGSMGGFYTFDEVVAELDAMHQRYPNIITEKDSVASSVQGRAVWTVKISDNPEIDEDEPEIFYNSLTHAREPGGMMAVMRFMYYLLENYGSDPEVTYLVDNRELYFMPVINPDGYVYNQMFSPNGGGMWRKNRRNNEDGTFGVDIARNYGYMWGYDNFGSVPDPGSGVYRGASAFSEPETQAVREFCVNHNFSICANYHTCWNVVFSPWSYNMTQTNDSTIFNNLISIATSLNGYRNGAFVLPPENYPSNGGVCDWMYGEITEKNRIFAVLPEVGSWEDGHWPIPTKISENSEKNIYPNLIYAWGPGIIEDVPFISSAKLNSKYYKPSSDTLILTVEESNPGNYNNSISAEILSSDGTKINTIELNKSDTVFNVSLIINSYNEDFYTIKLAHIGIDLPFKFYSKELKFTTLGPVELDSYNLTRLDSNTIFLDKLLFINNSALNSIPSVSINASSPENSIILINGEKNIGDIHPISQVEMTGGFLLKLKNSMLDSAEINIEISSNGVVYWENQLNLKIPENFENEDMITVFVDEVNDLSNWSAVGDWDLTSERYLSSPYCFTESPNRNYNNNANSTLTSKNQFKLINSIYSFLEFDAIWDIEYQYDYGMIQLSYDHGRTWIPLSGKYTEPGSGTFQPKNKPLYDGTQVNWKHEVVDISEYANSPFNLRFLFKSDGGVTWDGWYIDNIKLSTFSAIFGDQLFINKRFARKGIDSVLFRIRFSNPYNHEFSSRLIFSNKNQTIMDSIILNDDGTHHDLVENDNIFGAVIPPIAQEDFYYLSVKTEDFQLNKSITNNNLMTFTNVGPLVLDTFSVIIQDTLIGIMDMYLANLSESITVPDVNAGIITSDTNVTNISQPELKFYDILPGEMKKNTKGYMVFSIKNNPNEIKLLLEISSNNIPYWNDTLVVNLTPTKINNTDTYPVSFSLAQNYPNPFNPSTTIKYSIPKQINVTLKVFDLLGSEIAALVNKTQPRGNYEVKFDGSELTSGIYFYRLKAGEYVETRKMILIK